MQPLSFLFPLMIHLDHVLIGHVMGRSTVTSDFECLQNCIRKISCKSCNVHLYGEYTSRTCELNNQTRHAKSSDFKGKEGTTYYGTVQVSWVCLKWAAKRSFEQDKSSFIFPWEVTLHNFSLVLDNVHSFCLNNASTHLRLVHFCQIKLNRDMKNCW